MTLLDLENRFDKLLASHPRSKYLNPRTVKNFIYHFNSLGANEKEFIFNQLNGYLHEAEEADVLTRNECADLFNSYLLPVSKIYERDLGFAPKINLLSILVLFVGAGVPLFLLNAPAIVFYLLVVVLLLYYIHIFSKRTQRKVYGLMF